MKILCEYCDCGPSFVRSGWGKVFQAMGHQFVFWQPELKPAFDVFNEYEPDLFIGTTFGLDRAIYKCIASRPQMKVILYASAWGDLIDQINPIEYPIIIASDKEKLTLEKLKKETGKPDFVFLHYHDNWIDRTLGGWRSIGIEPVSMMNAADTFDYYPGVVQEKFKCDLAFVGGYWPYKAKNLDKWIVPLCYGKHKIKIFGNQPWNVPQYLGYVDNMDVRDIFASASICPNVSEPHSTTFNFDIIERPFKILSCGGFCISDYVQSSEEDVFGDCIPHAKTTQEFNDMIDYYLKNPEKRFEKSQKGRQLVLRSETYFDRVSVAFAHLGMEKESLRCLEVKNKYV